MREGCELFLETNELKVIWDRPRCEMIIETQNGRRKVISQEYWMDYEQFFQHVSDILSDEFTLSYFGKEQMAARVQEFLENPVQAFYTAKDVYYFTHMAYITGVKSVLKDVEVHDVDTLTQHLMELYPQFQKEMGYIFYEKVGDFAEKHLKKQYT